MKKEVTSDTAKIQRIIKDYYRQVYANRMDNLEEMGTFLRIPRSKIGSVPRLNQQEIENMKRIIISMI